MQGTLKVVSKHQVSASRSLLNHLFSEFPFFPSLDCCCHLLFFQRPYLLFSFRMLCPYCGLCFLCLSDSVSILQGFLAKPLGFSVCLSAPPPSHGNFLSYALFFWGCFLYRRGDLQSQLFAFSPINFVDYRSHFSPVGFRRSRLRWCVFYLPR